MRRIFKRRPAGGGGGSGSSGALTPATILGALLSSDFDVADPGVTLNAGNVQSIPNRGRDGAPLEQLVAANQPAFSAVSFAGGPGMTFDGVNDTLLCALNTSIPIGARPYMWIVYKATSGAVTNQIAGSIYGAAAPPYYVAWSNRTDGNMGGGLDVAGGGGATTGVVPNDTNTHLQEVASTVGGTAAFVRDNVAIAGIAGACTTLGAAMTTIRASGFAPVVSQLSTAVVRRIIVANDMPTAAQIAAMRAYIRAQPYGLTF